MNINENIVIKKSKRNKPRKIMKVNSSKYAPAESIHTNKRYWRGVFNDIDSATDEEIKESKRLLEVLPQDLYLKVCETLNMPILEKIKETRDPYREKSVRKVFKEPLLSFRKTLYIEKELDSDTDVEFSSGPEEEDEAINVHRQLLDKPEREQVTWPSHYLQPEREEDKTLIRKADDLTDRIANDFCKYMKELGGDQQSHLFTPKAIKELFQIEFDTHVARGVRVVTRELPCVHDKLAEVTGYPEKSRNSAIEREISRDIVAEKRLDHLVAFNRYLPLEEQYRAPRNQTKILWRTARHVPKDLVTLKTVWEGITNLKSVKEYCRWMIDHPEHRRAPYLCSLGMFDSAVLEARLTFEAQFEPPTNIVSFEEGPKPIDDIRKRLSELSDK